MKAEFFDMHGPGMKIPKAAVRVIRALMGR